MLRFTAMLFAIAVAGCTPDAAPEVTHPTGEVPAVRGLQNSPMDGGSCVGRCGGNADGCWCDSLCDRYGDCCDDKAEVCSVQGDTCDDPIPVDTVPIVIEGETADTSNATDQMHYASGACNGEDQGWGIGAPEQIYAFTAPSAGLYTVTLHPGPGFDSNLYVTGSCDHGEVQTCVAGDEEIGRGVQEQVSVPMEPGETVHIVVDGWGGGASGRYTLAIALAQTQCDVPFDHRFDAPREVPEPAPSRPHDEYVFRIAAHHNCLNCDLAVADETIQRVRDHADAIWITADALGAMRSVADGGNQNQGLEDLIAGGDWPIYTAANVSTLAWREMAEVGEDLDRVNSFDYQRTTSTDVHPSHWAMEVEPAEDMPGNLVIDDALLGHNVRNNPFTNKGQREAVYQYPMEFKRAEDVFDVDTENFPRYQVSATCKARAARSSYRPALPDAALTLADVPNAPSLRVNTLARLRAIFGDGLCALPMVTCANNDLATAQLNEAAWPLELVPSHIGFGRAGFVRHCLRPEDAHGEFLAARCFPEGPCPDDARGWDLYGGDTDHGHWSGDGVLDVEVHTCTAPGTAPYVRRFRQEFPSWDDPNENFGRVGLEDIACMVVDPSKPAAAQVIGDSIADHAAATGSKGVASDNMSHLVFGREKVHGAVPWRHPDGDRNVFVVGQGYNKKTVMHRPAYPEREIGAAQAQQNFTDDWANLWLETRSEVHCNPALAEFTWLPNTNPLLPVVQDVSQNQTFADEQEMTLDLLGGGMWDEKWGNLDFGTDLLRRRALLRLLAAQRISSLGRPALLSLQYQGFSDFDPDPEVNYDPTPLEENSLGEAFAPEPAGIDNSYAFARGLAAYLIVLDQPSLLLDPYRWYGDGRYALDGVGTFENFERTLAGTTWMRHFLDRDAGAPLMPIAATTEPASLRGTERDATIVYRRYENALAVMHTRGTAIGGAPIAVQAPEGEDWFLDVVVPWAGWAKTRDAMTPSPVACDVTEAISVDAVISCRKRNRRTVGNHSKWSGCELDLCHGQGQACLDANKDAIKTCHDAAGAACTEVCTAPGENAQTIVRRVHIPGGTWLRLHPNRTLLLWSLGAARDQGNEAMDQVHIDACADVEPGPDYPGEDVCSQLWWRDPAAEVRVALPAVEPGDCDADVRDFRCAPGDVE